MFLTLVVWVYMYVRRISFISSNQLNPQELAVPGALAQLSPPAVSRPVGQPEEPVELPVIFYAIALFSSPPNRLTRGMWPPPGSSPVSAPVLHSAVHCTFNLVLLRFYLYLFATLALWFMVIRAAFPGCPHQATAAFQLNVEHA